MHDVSVTKIVSKGATFTWNQPESQGEACIRMWLATLPMTIQSGISNDPQLFASGNLSLGDAGST